MNKYQLALLAFALFFFAMVSIAVAVFIAKLVFIVGGIIVAVALLYTLGHLLWKRL